MKYLLLTVSILNILASTLVAADVNTSTNTNKPTEVNNSDVFFDSSFLNTDGNKEIDLSRFYKGSSALPGDHTVDVYINQEFAFKQSIQFLEKEDGSVRPYFLIEHLKKLNLNDKTLAMALEKVALHESNHGYLLTDLVPEAVINFDSNELRLNIEFPQALMTNIARGSVSPELWDKGIPGFLLGYNVNNYRSEARGESQNSVYAGLNAQFNIGGWYLKHDGYYNWNDNQSEYKSISNYLQRDIPLIKGRVRIGETNTNTHLFNSLPIIGAELFNDNQMLPTSRQGYAPEVRGIAKTNAKVTIRQNNQIVYEKTVAPGEFIINDLYPTGSSGDLDVVVTEADGTIQTFKTVYTAIPELLRAGAHNYHVAIGQINDDYLSYNPMLLQGSYQRGLNNYVTGYTGAQHSPKYKSLLLGTSFNTLIGALSTDITQSWTDLSSENQSLSGQSYQIAFSKFIRSTKTNLAIAAYRYSTEDYLDYSTALRMIDHEQNGLSTDNVWRPKNRFNLTVNQSLPTGWGQVYATGYTQEYWNNNESDLQFQLGYSNIFRFINYSLSASRVRNTIGDLDTSWLFNINIPFDIRKKTVNLSAGIAQDQRSHSQNVGITTNFGKENQFSTGLNINKSKDNDMQISLNGGYRSPFSNITATHSHSEDYENTSLGLQGTLIAWKDGVVVTPYTGDTFTLVEAKNAHGAKITNYPGIRINRWGYAAVPYLTPYSMNEINLDPKGLPDSVEVKGTKVKVAPYNSAITKVQFDTKKGFPLLITLLTFDTDPIPFGAEVQNSNGEFVGSVGQMGQILVNVEQPKDQLKIRWGEKSDKQCLLNYDIAAVSTQQQQDLIPLTLGCE